MNRMSIEENGMAAPVKKALRSGKLAMSERRSYLSTIGATEI